jgi:hypothetical protein
MRKAMSPEIAFWPFCAIRFYPLGMDCFLTRDNLTSSYAIIRHNIRTYQSAGVLAVVRGKQRAEAELKKFEDSQDSSDRHEGWRHFIEKTDLEPGTDAIKATQRRQAKLESRESKALQETKTFPAPARANER